MKKKIIICILTIVISLPLSLVYAASQNMILGSFFGFALALGLDELVNILKQRSIVTKE